MIGLLRNRYLSRDWVGEWYKILKSRGENDMISFVRGHRNPNGTIEDREMHSFSHSVMDGTSAIPFYMTKFGEKTLPRSTDFKKKLSFFQILKLTLANLTIRPVNNTIWKVNNGKKIEDINSFARFALSREETLNFKKYCKEKKLSENAVLMEILNPLFFELIENNSDTQTWLFPVNMRGITNKRDPFENHSSFVPINVNKDTKADQIHSQMREKLKSLNYIGIWWVHHIGILLGLKRMSKLSYKSSLRNFWLGSFSNVGEWNTDNTKFQSISDEESWFFATPGSKNFPISMVTLTFNGILCWSLRIHPAITEDSLKVSNEILLKLKERVISLNP
jgi:hypothetical protein